MVNIPTGLSELDRITGGLVPGEVALVASRPAIGKSTLALGISRNVALDQGKAVAVFSLEMSGGEVMDRLTSAEAGLECWRVRRRTLGHDEAARAREARKTLKAAPILIHDDASLSVADMRAVAIGMKQEHPNLSLMVVDYLELIPTPGTPEDRPDVIADAWQGLQATASELQVPMLLLSQIHRFDEGRADLRPRLSDLNTTEADLTLLLYRDEVYHRKSPEGGIAEVTALREGASLGTCRLAFDEDLVRFADLDT